MLQDSDFRVQTPSRSGLSLHPCTDPSSLSLLPSHSYFQELGLAKQCPGRPGTAVPFFHLPPCSAPLPKPSHSSLSTALGSPIKPLENKITVKRQWMEGAAGRLSPLGKRVECLGGRSRPLPQ